MSRDPVLLGDIGGTHARFALARYALSLVLPLAAGLAARALLRGG